MQRIQGKEQTHGEGVTEQRQNIGHAGFEFFLQETFLPKCDYVIANSSDIFSAVVYIGIHYL